MLQDNEPNTLAEARGTVVLIDFWATFCEPCLKSLPHYQRLADQHAGALTVIGVCVDDPEDVSAAQIQAFISELGLSFSILWDKQEKTVRHYDPPAMPTAFLVDKDGVLRKVYVGPEGNEPGRIAGDVQALLR